MKSLSVFLCMIMICKAPMAQETNSAKQSAAEYIKNTIEESGIIEAKKIFSKIKSDTSLYNFSEREFNLLGYQFINKAKLTEALAVFEMNIKLFPQSTNVFDSFGEACLYIGNKEKAIESYRKIRNIDPENTSGETIIKNIEAEFEKRKYSKFSKLHQAVKKGDRSLIDAWLKINPEFLNQKSRDGNTALHLAVYGGYTEITEDLVSQGAEINIRNLLGQTPYNLAKSGNLDIIKQLLLKNSAEKTEPQFPLLVTKYLGQKEPGLKPEIFAPGIVSTHSGIYGNIVFSPDFKEACWTPNDANAVQLHGGLIISKFKNGKWTFPTEIRFLDEEYSNRSPFYSYDGKRLYFQGHLKSNQGMDQQEKFYYVKKLSTGWSQSILLDTLLNKYGIHWQFSLDKNNNLYFGGKLRGKENSGGIYISKFGKEKHTEPILIFEHKRLPDYVIGPAISPNGDFLLFTRVHPRGSPKPRIFSLYVSFKNKSGAWTEPQDVGELLKMDNNQPRITPDGKFIFYVGNDGLSYWVDAKIVKNLKPQNLN